MSLTPVQLQTLRTAIDVDPVLTAFPLSTDGYLDLANKLNTELAVPDFYVWKEHLTWEEIRNNGFLWVEVDGLTVGKARIWEWMFPTETASVNPSKQNIRAGIEECWKGNAGRLVVQASVFEHARKPANRVEKIFAVASAAPPVPSGNLGSVTHVATAVISGVTAADVEQARSLP